MKLADLKAVIDTLLLRGKTDDKKDGSIKPVNFGDAAHFVAKDVSSYSS